MSLFAIRNNKMYHHGMSCEPFRSPYLGDLNGSPGPCEKGHFGPNGHNLNKLGRGPLGDTKHKGEIGLEVSDKRII